MDTSTAERPRSVADRAVLVHDYTLGDVERMSGRAAMQVQTLTGMSYEDRYEEAWHAIVEALYMSRTRPEGHDLLDVGRKAILKEREASMRHHGTISGGEKRKSFIVYWHGRRGIAQDDFTESMVERMALPTALSVLDLEEYMIVAALAATGSVGKAAALLGMPRSSYSRRLKEARERFLTAWYAPETQPRPNYLGDAERCRKGHLRAEHYDGQACRMCLRTSRARNRVKRQRRAEEAA